MSEFNIEQRLKEAFEKTVPAFPESVLEQCSERKGTVTDMTGRRKTGRALKIALIAAALLLALAVTVTAVLSQSAPEGYISEAAATAIALENSGVNEIIVNSLAAELDGGVYKISFKFGLKDYPNTCDLRLNTNEIDAKTGEILSFDAVTHDDYMSEEEVIERAKELCAEIYGLSKEEVSKLYVLTCEFKENAMGYHAYTIRLMRDGDLTVYNFYIDPLLGVDLIER